MGAAVARRLLMLPSGQAGRMIRGILPSHQTEVSSHVLTVAGIAFSAIIHSKSACQKH